MKITWRLPENYWVGADGICANCGTRFELDAEDAPDPYGFEYVDEMDKYGSKTIQGYTIMLKVDCPVCKEEVFIRQPVT